MNKRAETAAYIALAGAVIAGATWTLTRPQVPMPERFRKLYEAASKGRIVLDTSQGTVAVVASSSADIEYGFEQSEWHRTVGGVIGIKKKEGEQVTLSHYWKDNPPLGKLGPEDTVGLRYRNGGVNGKIRAETPTPVSEITLQRLQIREDKLFQVVSAAYQRLKEK